MAGEAVVGALRIILGMDTAQVEDGAKKAGKSLDSFAKQVGAVFGGIQLDRALQATARALSDLTFGVIDSADKIGKLSQKLGVPVETLSGLKYAAEQADVSLESLGKGFGILSKNMNIAATQGTGPAAEALKALRIEVKDKTTGALKSANEVFLEVADRFVRMEDGAGKTALAIAIFGRAGADLIPLLNQGGGAILNMIDRARMLGLVLSKETTDAAQEFNDRMKDIGSIIIGVATQVTAKFLPVIQQMLTSFVNWVVHSNSVQKAAEALSRAIIFVADNMNLLVIAFQTWLALKIITFVANVGAAMITLTRAIIAMTAAKALFNLTALATIGRLALIAGVVAVAAGAFPQLNEKLKEVGESVAKLLPEDTSATIAKGLAKIGLDVRALTSDFKSLNDNTSAFLGFIGPTLEQAGKNIAAPLFGVNKEAERFRKHLDQLRMQAVEASGVFAGQLAPGFLAAAAGMDHLKGQVINVHDRLVVLGPEAQKLNQALLAIEGAKLTQEFLTPWQQYEQQLARINLLLANNKISAEVAAAAGAKAAADMAIAYGQAAQSIVGPLADAFKTAAGLNKKYAGIAKALAISEAIVATYLAATKAISIYGPTPIGFAAAAAAVAAGLANVAKISATEFAHGGTFKVGGSGGVDSQLVTFKATPGEMVDVRTPGQDRGGGTTEIVVRGMRPKDFYTGDMVREMFYAINQGLRDSHRIKFVES